MYVYIDETGDRGGSLKSSPIFGMAAVLLDEAGQHELRAAVDRLRLDFAVPANKVMSWKEHVKTHDRRRHAAEVLRNVNGLRLCYVYSVKSALAAESYLNDAQRFYNYVAYKIYKSVLWAARDWKGPGVRVWTRFGHVKGHDHRTTDEYIKLQAAADPTVPHELEQGLRWVSANTYRESQAADLYGGFLKAALWPAGEFGYVEPAYLLRVWPQLRNSAVCAIPLGIMSMPGHELLQREEWFPCAQCRTSNGSPGASGGQST
ncbi:DUF3800 domain-containing protein [Saccharothrix sp. NRRL B-16314]|uniref:DUF3800 domain-containing protein n=1 Tax=Saccharothrix sp. NRRL B-16314 TaxID=1463825 RepID=UPI001E458355|nr:DUF3800 domain-containing protein [Saccharothrix sp. NRRL B-16314]